MVVCYIRRNKENIDAIFNVNCINVDYGGFNSNPESEIEKNQYKNSGRDFLPHRICKHIEILQNSSRFNAICIDLDSIGLAPGILLACHLRLHNVKSELSKLPIIIMVNDILEFHKSPEWKELRGIHNFRITNGFFVLQKSELSRTIQDETGSKISGFQRELNENIGSSRFVASNLSEFKISEAFSSESDSFVSNHGVANVWAIHQWAKTIGCDETPELVKVFENVETNLYFKYLRSINPISPSDKISQDELNIRFKGKPKVLLIDDEVDKGWGEIFAHIFHNLNSIDFEEIGDDFKNKSQETIIEQSLKKIIENDTDLVILDFRLNSNDFELFNKKDVTSIRLLKKIKDYNPGIQVIVFSATNKVWNLQALQEVGADGFIHKDGSENIHQSIQRFVIQLTSGLEKAFWLKPFYKSFDKMKTNAKNLSDYFKVSLENNLSICFELLIKSFERKEYIKYAYLQLFHIVEEFIKEDSVFESGNNCYVVTPSLRYLVLSKKDPNKEDSPYYSALDFRRENGQYKVGKSKHTRRIDTYFIMSSILLFRNGLPTSGSENWQRINSIRNNKAAHPKGGIVKLKEVNMLSEFLKFILDESKIKPIESNHALKEQGTRRQIENLKKKWGAR